MRVMRLEARTPAKETPEGRLLLTKTLSALCRGARDVPPLGAPGCLSKSVPFVRGSRSKPGFKHQLST